MRARRKNAKKRWCAHMSELQYGFAWDDSFALGHEQVDMQHQQLFSLVNDLVGSCMRGDNTVDIQKTLFFLVDYVVRHFQDEEALQAQCGFPGHERHKQLHANFKVIVGKLVERFIQNASPVELSSDINKIVVRWLVDHIHHEDKKIGEHLRSAAKTDSHNA